MTSDKCASIHLPPSAQSNHKGSPRRWQHYLEGRSQALFTKNISFNALRFLVAANRTELQLTWVWILFTGALMPRNQCTDDLLALSFPWCIAS